MSNEDMSAPEFQKILSLIADRYENDELVTEYVDRLAKLTRGEWTLANLKVVGGGPSIDLNVRTKNRIIKLSLDLAAKLNVLVFKKYANEKNYKHRSRD
jgi:hypothetical protein